MEFIKNFFKKYREIITYLINGVITTIISFLAYLLASRIFNIDVTIANIIKWIVGVLYAFISSKLWVFKSSFKNGKVIKEFLEFVSGRLLTLIFDEGIVIVGVKLLHINDLIVQLIDAVFVTVANYLISKLIVFKKNK